MSNPRSPQFGAILFRASELIGLQGDAAFKRLGVGVPGYWISIVLALHRRGPLSSSDLSEHIGISRQVIESRLKPGVKSGFFDSRIDPHDSRRRIYEISAAARPVAERTVAIMTDFESVYARLWEEMGIDLEAALLAMEAALKRQGLTERLCAEHPRYLDELESLTS